MITRFRSVVGRKQIAASVNKTTADYTRSARADMAGVMKNYQAFCKHMQNCTPEVLLDALKPAFELSQEYVPKKTGALAASGYLHIIAFRGIPTVEIGYGLGGEPDYAAAVHENMEWRHQEPTQAKYLERALDETYDEMWQTVVDELGFAGGFS